MAHVVRLPASAPRRCRGIPSAPRAAADESIDQNSPLFATIHHYRPRGQIACLGSSEIPRAGKHRPSKEARIDHYLASQIDQYLISQIDHYLTS
jgi:hypothetical protein